LPKKNGAAFGVEIGYRFSEAASTKNGAATGVFAFSLTKKGAAFGVFEADSGGWHFVECSRTGDENCGAPPLPVEATGLGQCGRRDAKISRRRPTGNSVLSLPSKKPSASFSSCSKENQTHAYFFKLRTWLMSNFAVEFPGERACFSNCLFNSSSYFGEEK
jgi:hypothetical protein